MALATYGGGVRRLTGKLMCSEKASIKDTRPGGNQQLERGAADVCRTTLPTTPQIQEMKLHMSKTQSGRRAVPVAHLEHQELLSAILLCPSLRDLHLSVPSHFELEALQPLQQLAALTKVSLEFEYEYGKAMSVWSLAGLLQLLPVAQAIGVQGPGLAFDLPALSKPHPLQHLNHRSYHGLEIQYHKLVLPPRGLTKADGESLKGLKSLHTGLDNDSLKQVCYSLTALESLVVDLEDPQDFECITNLTCLTNLSLTYSTYCSPGELSALTNLESLHVWGRFKTLPSGLSCAAQLTRFSIYGLVPRPDDSVMALTALRTLELGNVDGGQQEDEWEPIMLEPMDLWGLRLDSLKHLHTLGLYGCLFSISSRFLSVCHPSLQKIYLQSSCPDDSRSLAYFLALAACVNDGEARFSITVEETALYFAEDDLDDPGRSGSERDEGFWLSFSYNQNSPSGKLIRFGKHMEAIFDSDTRLWLGSYRDFKDLCGCDS